MANTRNLPQFSRDSLEPPDKEDSESWQPKWKCHCCRDSGIVNQNLARLIIPDYDHFHDKRPLCQKSGCDAADYYFNDTLPEELKRSHDYRFTRAICEELDEISREDWKETLALWHEQRKAGRKPEAENAKRIFEGIVKIATFSKPTISEEDIEF